MQRIAVADVMSAQALATAAGDVDGAKCWGYWLPIAQSPLRPGLATAIELRRVAQLGVSKPECAPIAADLLTRGLVFP